MHFFVLSNHIVTPTSIGSPEALFNMGCKPSKPEPAAPKYVFRGLRQSPRQLCPYHVLADYCLVDEDSQSPYCILMLRGDGKDLADGGFLGGESSQRYEETSVHVRTDISQEILLDMPKEDLKKIRNLHITWENGRHSP